ncbi:sugar phosphate isomerase/epimerase family protein [Phycisphaera mikurensis]|uniref:Xylose isomerase-like TIM barrel domain-containing protein n=1 Tax=Phycisphaera mikurensis (strain NBRC 102666 / KCTC 22515 / FYK2301M01) TaxID=1142394 RepID=I0IDZ7_PHYMF|nr:TIM barrel protein [Phycisphaera mikurensis]MBB6441292.1 hypothetical protein [Phycisphaera mikurensis]BAM03485.1 hypothetical protein PSMK_13260 [Phycisphaera mikurensis NBRC 102666]
MELKLLRSMWGAPEDPAALVGHVVGMGMDGVEGPPPPTPAARADLRRRLDDAGLVFVAEACTGRPRGDEPAAERWWMADPGAPPERHLDDLRRVVDGALEMNALLVSGLTGFDAWPLQRSIDFLGELSALDAGIPATAETHRGRSLFNPWVTDTVLAALPGLELTCDFSHWCVVAERLIDSELPSIERAAARCRHLHGRVGWAQSAQVGDPRDPVHADALAAHERWWDLCWSAQEARGFSTSTMTLEFGPDGYTPLLPFTRQPVSDLNDVIRWMADRQRGRFAARGSTP